jgi:hypothetical protein
MLGSGTNGSAVCISACLIWTAEFKCMVFTITVQWTQHASAKRRPMWFNARIHLTGFRHFFHPRLSSIECRAAEFCSKMFHSMLCDWHILNAVQEDRCLQQVRSIGRREFNGCGVEFVFRKA